MPETAKRAETPVTLPAHDVDALASFDFGRAAAPILSAMIAAAGAAKDASRTREELKASMARASLAPYVLAAEIVAGWRVAGVKVSGKRAGGRSPLASFKDAIETGAEAAGLNKAKAKRVAERAALFTSPGAGLPAFLERIAAGRVTRDDMAEAFLSSGLTREADVLKVGAEPTNPLDTLAKRIAKLSDEDRRELDYKVWIITQKNAEPEYD